MNDTNYDIINNNELEEIVGRLSNTEVDNREFKPWHRPRKQWVRSCQWRNSLKRLILDNSYTDINLIKYFSFPGEDCLDIKILSEQCNQNNKNFYFEGIESDTIGFESILSQIMDLEYIDSNSKIHAKSNFEEISYENSSLYSKIASNSPFHVVNLDFTNSIFSPGHGKQTMQSICRIMNRQLDQQYLKWQLYITTRCDIGAISTECLKDYMARLLDNCKNNEEFLMLIKQNICNTIEIDSTESYLIENSQNFEKLAIMAFMKWLIALAVAKNVKMSLLSAAEYKVNDSVNSDMISLVFEFKKHECPTDPTEITYSSNVIDEREVAYNVCNNFLEKIKNVDAILENEPNTLARLTQEIKTMLSNIGYDISLYPY